MASNIKNEDVERLAGEVAALTGESKTQVIREQQRQTEEHERAILHRHRRVRARQARALVREQART